MSGRTLTLLAVVVVLAAGSTDAGHVPPRPLAPAAFAGAVSSRIRLTRRLPSLARVSRRDLAISGAVSLGSALLLPPMVLLGPVLVVGVAVRRERAAGAAHARAVARAVPELVDQLGLAVGAGLSLPMALATVERWLPPELGCLVRSALDRLAFGSPMLDVLVHLRDELPAAARRPLLVIIAATRDGAPLGPNLERAATEARLLRRRDAEVRARRLPVLMLLPLVLCVLPAFVLLTLVPLIVGSLDGLSLSDAFPAP